MKIMTEEPCVPLSKDAPFTTLENQVPSAYVHTSWILAAVVQKSVWDLILLDLVLGLAWTIEYRFEIF